VDHQAEHLVSFDRGSLEAFGADPDQTSGRTRLLLDSLEKRRGRVTNMVRVLANSPAAVNAFFSFNAAMAASSISGDLRERIAIAIAQANDCKTCLAAHTAFGREEGVPADELDAARRASSVNPTYEALLRFAIAAYELNGKLDDVGLAELRALGVSDSAMLDVLATVYINAFTNAVNHLAQTDADYPVPERLVQA